MTAQRLLIFAGLFVAAWAAIVLLMVCGWCIAGRLHAANMRRVEGTWGSR